RRRPGSPRRARSPPARAPGPPPPRPRGCRRRCSPPRPARGRPGAPRRRARRSGRAARGRGRPCRRRAARAGARGRAARPRRRPRSASVPQYRRPSPLRQLPRHRYIGPMARLWRYVGRYRLRYLGGIACLLGATSLAMAVPWLLKQCIDAVTRDAAPRALLGYLGLIVVIALAQGVVRTFSRFIIFNAGRDIEYDLRNDLFRHLETLPLAFYQQRHTGDLMSRLVNDVTAVRMLLGPGLLNFINTPVAYLYGL